MKGRCQRDFREVSGKCQRDVKKVFLRGMRDNQIKSGRFWGYMRNKTGGCQRDVKEVFKNAIEKLKRSQRMSGRYQQYMKDMSGRYKKKRVYRITHLR